VEREYPGRETIQIETTPSNDNRSYHVSSRKISERLGYRPEHSIEDAVRDLCGAFQATKFRDSLSNDNYVNVKTIKALGLT
jgi:nucleoside-diphosphate-sugar epimerase